MIGVRGGSVLAIAGIVGVYCGSTGWSNRDAGQVTTPTVSVGESLSSTAYASDSYQVWPGTPSAAARSAESGLKVTVTQQAGGINVTVSSHGVSDGAHYYAGGAKVYVIRSNSVSQSLVVTDSKGRIVD
jgi:hypothetical protein